MLCCMHRAGVIKGGAENLSCVRESNTPQLNIRFTKRMNWEMQLAGHREPLYPAHVCLPHSICYYPVSLKIIAPAMLLSLGQSALRALRVQSWSRSASREATAEIVPLML